MPSPGDPGASSTRGGSHGGPRGEAPRSPGWRRPSGRRAPAGGGGAGWPRRRPPRRCAAAGPPPAPRRGPPPAPRPPAAPRPSGRPRTPRRPRSSSRRGPAERGGGVSGPPGPTSRPRVGAGPLAPTSVHPDVIAGFRTRLGASRGPAGSREKLTATRMGVTKSSRQVWGGEGAPISGNLPTCGVAPRGSSITRHQEHFDLGSPSSGLTLYRVSRHEEHLATGFPITRSTSTRV